ncbi:MAG: N-acetyl-gamma-glutamyl-phosphate reductase [Solirubrobacterales bacterium]|nr:N-acetyl-gamma-glutamyl-phosphate reductase [Solirubrobacterales bacterium]
MVEHRVAVVGAAGFGGAVAASILAAHPFVELTALTARSDAGRRLRDVYPQHRVDLTMEELDVDRIADAADAAVIGYPHKAAAPVVRELRARGVKVVDLSADFRLSRELYEREYQPHEAPELLGEAIYGLPEIGHREAIAKASLVGSPGCYPTASLLALWPLRELAADAIVDAKSGVSGAGREPSATTHFVSVDETVKPYKVEGHRHRAELDQELAGLAVTFTPHLLPIDQGLMASCYVTPKQPLTGDEVRAIFHDAYADEPFVELADAPPGVREVRETNLCRIHATVEPATGRVLVFSAIDNLWKGAAGQAVQALNLMLGLPETAGLVR